MDTVSVSWEVLAGLLGKTGVELQSALMTDGQDGKKVLVDQSIIDKKVGDSFRARLVEVKDTGKDEYISQGKRTAFEQVEKTLTESYGVPKGTKWDAAISQIETNAKSKAATSDEVIQSSEAYKQLVKKLEEEAANHTATKKGFSEKWTNDKFDRQLAEILKDETLGIALPDVEIARNAQIKSFSQMVRQVAQLKLNEDDSIIPTDKDGKPLEDANFNPISLKGFIAQHAKTFWPPKSPDPTRQAPPAGDPNGTTPPAQPNGGNKFPAWKSSEEFTSWMNDQMAAKTDPAILEAAYASFESQPK